jgi:N-acetylmuramoyl-L-alanine amidase
MKICIDPGHGQYGNPGVIKGYYEGTQVWKLGQKLQAELVALGWQVTNTRPRLNDDPALEKRGQMAAGHDLFISLHTNAPGPSAANYSNIRGVAIYDSVADRMDYLEIPLCAEIAKVMSTPNNGVKHRWNTRDDRQGQDYYGVLRNAVTVAGCPDAMLIEHGYHTNQADCAWMMLDQNLAMLATAEAELINRVWRKQADPDFREDDDMIYCQQGQGSVDKPDPDVLEMQNGFIRLGVEMKNPTTGKVYTVADGSYGPASAAGVTIFEKTYGLAETDGSVFTDLHIRAMLSELSKLPAGTGITQEQLQADQARAKELADQLVAAQEQINQKNELLINCSTTSEQRRARLKRFAAAVNDILEIQEDW